jgi:hypothetical protein
MVTNGFFEYDLATNQPIYFQFEVDLSKAMPHNKLQLG